MTRKLNIDKGYSDTREGRPAGNSVYVAIAGEVVNRRSVLLSNFVLNGQVSASNPLLHIHAKRYGLTYNIEKWKFDDYKLLKSVMVNGDRRTIKKLK